MKKLLSIILSLSLLAGGLCVYADSGEETNNIGIEFLSVLSVLPEDFDPAAEMTRAEFVNLVILSLGFDTETDDTTAYFLDVDNSHPYYGSISLGMQLGIITGTGDYTFKPDDKITYEQAVRVAVAAAGYGEVAERKGSFSAGYMSIADSADMLEGLERTTTGANLAALVFNMLKTPKLAVSAFTGDGVEYTDADKDNTLLKEYHNILWDEGIVTETGYSAFTKPGTLGKGRVKIDDEIFTDEVVGADKYFGREIVYFYYDGEESGDNELIFAYTEKTVKELEIAAADITNVDLAAGKITYEVNDRQKTQSFSKTPYVIFNGVSLPDYTKIDLMPEYGSVRLLDGDDDGTYEFLFINSVQYFVVGAVNAADKKLYEKYTHEMKDYEDEELFLTITKNGEEISLDKISEMNVLSIMESRDKINTVIKVSDKSVTGEVTSLSDEGAEIDGTVYDVYSGINKPLIVGAKNTMYISEDDIIVATEVGTDKKYAYLCRADLVNEETETYTIKVVTQDGGTKYLNIAEKASYNGGSKEDKKDIHGYLDTICKGGLTRIIEYELNADGEIKKVYSALDNRVTKPVYDENEFTLDYSYSGSDGLRYYKRMLGGKYMLAANCIVWIAPKPDENYIVDAEKVTVSNAGYFEDGDRYTDLKLFNYNEFMAAGMCEYVGDVGEEVNATTTAFVVDKAKTELFENGDIGVRVYGYRGGKYTTLSFDGSENYHNISSATKIGQKEVKDLKRGDVIQVQTDDGIVSVYRILFNTDDGIKDAYYHSTGGGYNEYPGLETMVGTMENISDDSLIVNVNGEKNLFFTNNAPVYVIDNGELRTGSIYDICTTGGMGVGDKVFIRANRKMIQEIVVYE